MEWDWVRGEMAARRLDGDAPRANLERLREVSMSTGKILERKCANGVRLRRLTCAGEGRLIVVRAARALAVVERAD